METEIMTEEDYRKLNDLLLGILSEEEKENLIRWYQTQPNTLTNPELVAVRDYWLMERNALLHSKFLEWVRNRFVPQARLLLQRNKSYVEQEALLDAELRLNSKKVSWLNKMTPLVLEMSSSFSDDSYDVSSLLSGFVNLQEKVASSQNRLLFKLERIIHKKETLLDDTEKICLQLSKEFDELSQPILDLIPDLISGFPSLESSSTFPLSQTKEKPEDIPNDKYNELYNFYGGNILYRVSDANLHKFISLYELSARPISLNAKRLAMMQIINSFDSVVVNGQLIQFFSQNGWDYAMKLADKKSVKRRSRKKNK